jgi:uridine phosphorylase
MQTQQLSQTDLILNADGSAYHLHIRDEHIADNVIVVGDQSRVEQISKHFDKLEFKMQNREFVTHTGLVGSRRITVLSTGIGTDNIDIAINELDAAVNIDPVSRQVREQKRKLNIIRIGTSGALQPDIPVGSFVISEYGLGFDGLIHYYDYNFDALESKLSEEIAEHLQLNEQHSSPYICKGSEMLISKLGKGMIQGITATASGFYGPQGRKLRLVPKDPGIEDKLSSFSYQHHRVTNFEMETSALYGLGNMLGHDCCTCCVIIANRIRKEFSKDYHNDVDRLIQSVLGSIG